MTVETAVYVNQLDETLPSNTDFLSEGDNHITLIKDVLKNTFNTSNTRYQMDTIAAGIVPIGAITMWWGTVETIPSGWALCDGRTVARTDGGGDITTPDLAGKFIRGVATNVSQGTTGGSLTASATSTPDGVHSHVVPPTNTGGVHNHQGETLWTALTIDQLPAHNHGGGAHTHTEVKAAIEFRNTSPTTGYYLSPATSGQTVVDQTVNTAGSGTIITTQGSGNEHQHLLHEDPGHTHTIGNTGLCVSHTHDVEVDTVPPYMYIMMIMKH
jgi:hypothetical protein